MYVCVCVHMCSNVNDNSFSFCICFSDSPICSLEPVESIAFDGSQLQGVTASHLMSLMNLTFIGDEKLASNPLFPRPPSPATVTDDVGSHKSVKLDSEGLEKQLDEDMARALADDVAAHDHNADKKFGAGTQTDSCDGAVTQSSSVTGLPGTTVKSLSSTALSLSGVMRDGLDDESAVDNTSHSAPGLCSADSLHSIVAN